jgi:hypothetical protein
VRSRTSGDPEIVVTNDLDFGGPIGERIGEHELVLWITEREGRRIYDGRDFQGGGTPFGRLLLGQDFIIPWGLETHVQVQVLPDGATQLYSNLAFEGPRLVVALGGFYATGVDDVHAFEAAQRAWSAQDGAWREGATWRGVVDVHTAGATSTSEFEVRFDNGQLTVVADVLDGALQTTVERTTTGEVYRGPDIIGNAARFGPMLFGARHIAGRGRRMSTRDVLLDGGERLAVAYQLFQGDERTHVIDGVLNVQR